MNITGKHLAIGAVALLALIGTAVGASYATRESLAPEQIAPTQQVQAAPVHHPVHHQQVASAQPPCNDHNIVGTGLGAVAGGVLGNQFGKGAGKTVTTVGGAAGGAYLGNAYIPTRGATCN